MINRFKISFGLVLAAIFIAIFIITTDLKSMFDALANANYWYIPPAVGMYFISVFFRTIRWQILLRHMKPVGVKKLFPVVVIGYMANNLLPMRLGELVRSYYLGEREGISKTSTLVTIFIERVLDGLVLLFFIAVVAVFVPLSGLAEEFSEIFGLSIFFIVLLFVVPFVTTFMLLLLMSVYTVRGQKILMSMVTKLPKRFESPIQTLTFQVFQGLVPLQNPKKLSVLMLVSLPIWLFEAGLFFLIGLSFNLNDLDINISDLGIMSILLTSVSNIGSSIPAAPGGIGLFELLTRETLVLLTLHDVSRSVAGAYATVVHAALILPIIVMGQLFLWGSHISFLGVIREKQEIVS